MKDAPRRQGGEPRRNVQDRHPGSPGLHHHHGSLRGLLRGREEDSRGRRPRDRRGRQEDGSDLRRQEVRRPGRPAARLRPLRRGPVHARDDEHDPQPRPHRRQRRRAGQEDRQPPLRLRQLPPAHRHVRLAPRWAANTKQFEHEIHAHEGTRRRSSSTPTSRPTTSRNSSSGTRPSTRSTSTTTSRRTRRSS